MLSVPSFSFPGRSMITVLNLIVSPSSKLVIDSTCESDSESDLSVPASLLFIAKRSPTCSHALGPIFAKTLISPLIMVVSLSTIGTIMFMPVFVEFQIFSTSLPPVEDTVPVLKSSGGVLSKTTQLAFVVLVTSRPEFPAESEKLILKTTGPSVSVSKNE